MSVERSAPRAACVSLFLLLAPCSLLQGQAYLDQQRTAVAAALRAARLASVFWLGRKSREMIALAIFGFLAASSLRAQTYLEQTRTAVRNDSATLTLTTGWANAPFVPTAGTWTLIFTVKALVTDLDASAKIQKVSGSGIAPVSGAAAVTVDLVPADSVNLALNTAYVYDVQAQHNSTGAIRTIARGKLTFSGDVTLGTTTSVPVYTTNPPSPTGGGTVTSVSVATANGFSGSVATATSTPAITIVAGAITPSSVAATGTVTGSNLSGTNTGDQDLSGYVPTARTVNGHALSGNISVTASDLTLGNVDNTSDASKPVSTAQQTALDAKVDENAAITPATKTKITYDAKGLVTAGADATTADIADSTDRRYLTDAQQTVIGNTSGTNTGDQTNITGNAATVTTIPTLSGDVTNAGNVVTVAANSVALGTDTTGSYIATIADSGSSEITVANSGTESAAVTLAIASTLARDSELPVGANPTATAGETAVNGSASTFLRSDAAPAVAAASTTAKGILELATDAEVGARTDTSRPVVPAQLGGQIFDFTIAAGAAGSTGAAPGPYTWSAPAWAKVVRIIGIGGGGGGGSGRRGAAGSDRSGGGGGGGSGVSDVVYALDTMPGSPWVVTIGAAGTGGAGQTSDDTNGNSGTAGVNSLINAAGQQFWGAYGYQPGAGGATTSGSGGANNFLNMWVGQGGAAGSNSTGAGSSAGGPVYGSPGGGGGGGVNAANTNANGGGGGRPARAFTGSSGGVAGGTAPGGNGVNGATVFDFLGASGSGGAGNAAGSGGAGGAGGSYGAGGGGGGASVNGNASGAGGNGAAGFVRIICW